MSKSAHPEPSVIEDALIAEVGQALDGPPPPWSPYWLQTDLYIERDDEGAK